MRVITLVIWIVLLLAADFGYKKAVDFTKNDIFRIEKIKIAGDYENLKGDIIDPVINLKGKNLWYISTKEIEDSIKKDIRIKEVRIKREFPDTLSVEIKEKQPHIFCVLNGKIYLADEKGTVYGYRQENSKEIFPVVYLDNNNQKEELFSVALKVCGSIFKDYISSIYVDQGIVNIVLKDGVVIKSDKGVEKEKYDTGAKLYIKLKQDNVKVSYLDVRFKDIIAK